jgi:hypothetical protein
VGRSLSKTPCHLFTKLIFSEHNSALEPAGGPNSQELRMEDDETQVVSATKQFRIIYLPI